MTGEGRGRAVGRRDRLRAFWRKRLQPVWQDLEWPLVGGVWVFGLILGFVGFSRHALAAGGSATFWDTLYRALQLIVLQSGDVAGPLPWQLDVARFVMPAVAGYAAIQALLAIFSEQWHILGLRFAKDHAVVCGLGERGLRLTQDLLDHGFRVVVIEKDDKNPLLDLCHEQGAMILTGDAADGNLLRKAGVKKAKFIVAVCADDGTNAEIALKARELTRSRRGRALSAFVHVDDLELCNFLSGGGLATAEGDPIRVEFFNVLERGARLMLEEHPPFEGDVKDGGRLPRIVIVGLGKMGRSLAVQGARDWWLTRAGSGRKLRIAVVDKEAETKTELLRLQYPQLDEACDFDVWPLQKNAPEFERGDFLCDAKGRLDVDAIYICFDDDVHVLVDALTLHRKTRARDVPIVIRMSREGGLASLLKDDRGAGDYRQLHVFGVLDRTCVLEALLRGRHEILARAIHEDYVRRLKASGATPEANPSMVPWEDLPEDLKESNRHQADHIEVKLSAIGCGLQSLTDWKGGSFERLPDEVKAVFDVELLARMEHERWCEERRRQGWTHALGQKDLTKKTSPHLVPWEKLPPEIQDYDRDAVRGLPSFLAQAGFQIYRRT
jgi:Trk K+ transport system NAD-binding subunit